VAALLDQRGLETEVVADDDALWDVQRAGQRSTEHVVVRVSGVQDQAGPLLEFAREHGARVVSRAALGLSWITVTEAAHVDALRTALAPSACVVLDAPAKVRAGLDAWGPLDPGSTALMERVRERFDPTRTCAPGILAGGI
jgi:glycolate oxidase FAD binding subunit